MTSLHERGLALGDFLRSRRERLDPARLGLPRWGRTRTPGLRREEVAELARIGVTWYTKLEQGRAQGVSARALSAVAAALQCSESETLHLFTLAGLAPPAMQAPDCSPLAALSCTHRQLLEHLQPLPAVIMNARFDILGANGAYCELLGLDLDAIAPADRNTVYLALTHPRWRERVADYDTILPVLVARFRSAMAQHLDDPVWLALLQRNLDASPAFREAWQQQHVCRIDNRVKRFRHPDIGVFALRQVNWWSAPQDGERLIVYMPVDEDGERALPRLAEAIMPA